MPILDSESWNSKSGAAACVQQKEREQINCQAVRVHVAGFCTQSQRSCELAPSALPPYIYTLQNTFIMSERALIKLHNTGVALKSENA